MIDQEENGPRSNYTGVMVCSGALAVLMMSMFGSGSLVRIGLPFIALTIAIRLYRTSSPRYLVYCLWLWLLTPELRRLIDWKFGFLDQNPVLLTPFLASAVAGTSLFSRRLSSEYGRAYFPYGCCCAAIAYGACVGALRTALRAPDSTTYSDVCYGILNWCTPIFLGLYVIVNRARSQQMSDSVRSLFELAVPLLGLYGIYQFLFAPPWDVAWLEGLPAGWANTAFGRPFPYEIRVWGTLNAPGPFANVLMAGMLILLTSASRWRWIGLALGGTALLLSLVRTSWLGFAVGLILLLPSFRGDALRRFAGGLILIPVLLAPLAVMSQVFGAIQARLSFLTSGQSDGSLQDRQKMYETLTPTLLGEPSGIGVRNNLQYHGFALDSAWLQLLIMLGVLGSLFYIGGLVSGGSQLRAKLSLNGRVNVTPPQHVYRVIVVVLLVETLAGNIFVNVSGVILWLSFALWQCSQDMFESESANTWKCAVNSLPRRS